MTEPLAFTVCKLFKASQGSDSATVMLGAHVLGRCSEIMGKPERKWCATRHVGNWGANAEA